MVDLSDSSKARSQAASLSSAVSTDGDKLDDPLRKVCSKLKKTTIENTDSQMNISEYVSLHYNDTNNQDNVSSLANSSTKAIRYLHKKRLAERGYRLSSKKLGEGGFGAVYRVYPKNDRSKPLACKILILNKEDPCDNTGDRKERLRTFNKTREAALKSYSNEVYVMASSRHENIVNMKHNFIYSHEEAASKSLITHSYIIMELATLGTLYSRLKKYGPFLDANAQYYMHQLADAILDLHQRGIAHRDLKLGNVLLTEREGGQHQEIVKVC